MKVDITQYLSSSSKRNIGICMACKKEVGRSERALAQHKRRTCKSITDEEKKLFEKEKSSEESDESDNENPPKRQCQLTDARRKEIDTQLGQLIFNEALPLSTSQSPSFISIIKSLNPQYGQNIPSVDAISNRILNEFYNKKFENLRKLIDRSSGITLMTDVYTDLMKRHFTNFIIKIPSNEKTFFYKIIETTKTVQDSTEVAKLISLIIKEIRENRISFVLTDNPNIMLAAKKILEKEFLHIHIMGCAAHALDLMDILNKLNNNEEVVKNADMIIEFFNNHQWTRNLLITKSTTRIKTRWFGSYMSFKSLLDTQNDLITIITNNKAKILKNKPDNISRKVCEVIMNKQFWEELTKLVEDIKSLSIGQIEGDDDYLELIYSSFSKICNNSQDNVIKEIS